MINDVLWRPSIFPFNIIATPGSGTLAMNAANTYMAFSVLVRSAKVFSKFRFYASGTGEINSITVELQADNGSGNPSGTALDTATITTFDNTAAWREATFTGAVSLTAGATYWVVIKNTTGTPTSNYPTVTFTYGLMPPYVNTDSIQVRFAKKSTTDAGSTWANQTGTTGCYMAGFTDGSWYGVPTTTGSYFNTSGVDRAYSGVELGGVGVTPDDMWMNVVGAWGWIRRVASPGVLQFKLYAGTSLLAQSLDVPQAQTSTNAVAINGFFGRNIRIPPKTLIRLTITADGGDNASNYYYLSGQTGDANYPDNAPTPFSYTRIESGAATDTPGKFPAIALILDGYSPAFPAPINRRQFNAMR